MLTFRAPKTKNKLTNRPQKILAIVFESGNIIEIYPHVCKKSLAKNQEPIGSYFNQ